jgi:hypothetical protein
MQAGASLYSHVLLECLLYSSPNISASGDVIEWDLGLFRSRRRDGLHPLNVAPKQIWVSVNRSPAIIKTRSRNCARLFRGYGDGSSASAAHSAPTAIRGIRSSISPCSGCITGHTGISLERPKTLQVLSTNFEPRENDARSSFCSGRKLRRQRSGAWTCGMVHSKRRRYPLDPLRVYSCGRWKVRVQYFTRTGGRHEGKDPLANSGA